MLAIFFQSFLGPDPAPVACQGAQAHQGHNRGTGHQGGVPRQGGSRGFVPEGDHKRQSSQGGSLSPKSIFDDVSHILSSEKVFVGGEEVEEFMFPKAKKD